MLVDTIPTDWVDRPTRRTDSSVRLMTINISGPSVERAQRLAAYLEAIDADVLVLTETRQNSGTGLLYEALQRLGYAVVSQPVPHSRERGVAIAHKRDYPVRRLSHRLAVGHRLASVLLDLPRPVIIMGAYVPSRDASAEKTLRKRSFLTDMSQAISRATAASEVIFMGDLNVISRDHEPRYTAFRSWEYETIEQFARYEMLDAYNELYPARQVHSWIGRKGSGYRYDYAYLSETLRPALVACDYVHTPRTAGLTDHAAVVLEINGRERNALPVAIMNDI
jgi:exodeoxyribonuclease-3